MNTFSLEIAKIKRRRALPIPLAVMAMAVLWSGMARTDGLAKNPGQASAALVVNDLTSLLPMLLPLLVAVTVVRVAGAEQDADMLSQLFACGASRTRLLLGKLTLVAALLAISLGLGFLVTLGWASAQRIAPDLGLAGQAYLLCLVAALELAAPLLVLALRQNRQAAVIGIGLALGLAGQLLALAPRPVLMLLPNTQIAAANPTRWILADGYITGYRPAPEQAALIPLVALIAAVVVGASIRYHSRKEIES